MIRNERGQTLIFVLATMVVALAIGVGVSLRSLSSISRVSSTDTATRAIAAAEGGAERYLGLTTDQLADAVSGTCPAGTVASTEPDISGCEIVFDPSTGDNITAKAVVSVANYGSTPSGSSFTTSVKKDELVEINLAGFGGSQLTICWSEVTPSPPYDPDMLYTVYSQSGVNYTVIRGAIEAQDSRGAPYEQNFSAVSNGAANGYNDCEPISGIPGTSGTRVGLRLLPINAIQEVKIGIFPTGGNLPAQGFQITSYGRLHDFSAEQEITKKVIVTRSRPFVPAMFDFNIYSQEGGL